jgi:hypothetical protein
MRLALFALALTLPAASSALPASPCALQPSAEAPAPARTREASPRRGSAGTTSSRATPARLRPRSRSASASCRPGDLTLAVVNQVGDCMEPAIIRQGYGLGGR